MVDRDSSNAHDALDRGSPGTERQWVKPHSLWWHCRRLVGLHEPPEDVGDWLNAALAVVVGLASLIAIGAGLGSLIRLLLGWGWPAAVAAGCGLLLVVLLVVYCYLSRRWATEDAREERVGQCWWIVLCFVAVGVVSWAVVGGSDLLAPWTTPPTPTASPVPPTVRPLPTVTATPAPPDVRISYVEYDPQGPDHEGEYVLIENLGDDAQDMAGWTLEDEAHHTYRFSPFTLEPGAGVKVWTGAGEDSPTDLYWGCKQGMWTNDGDVAYLKDNRGGLVDEYSYQP
jgi:hypothetical protein